MAPSSDENDIPAIGIKCFEITKILCNQGSAFTFKVTCGDFSFSLDRKEMRLSPASGPVVKTKKKSPSSIERDNRRRMDFLKRKKAASSLSSDVSMSVPVTSSATPIGPDSQSSVITPGAAALQRNIDQPESTICICGSLPCVCISTHQSSAKENQVPTVKLRKSTSGWTTTTSDGPRSSSTLPAAPVCVNCSEAFLGPSHQCGDQEHPTSQSDEISGTAVEVEILDMDACKTLVSSDFHTADEKQDILRKNCLAIFKIEPIDIPTARYCFSFSQYFKLKRDHQTLGFDVHHLINNVFNPQFDREMQKLGN